MPYETIISPAELNDHLWDPDWVILDCRFSLADTERGRRDYRQSHIPGAIYVHLDEDLSGPVIPGETSRHPFPDLEEFGAKASAWGIDETVQVVAYDDRFGAIAARVWGMLRWLGHETVAVLDGGWPLWLEEGYPTTSEVIEPDPRDFTPRPNPDLLVDVEEVLEFSQDPETVLLDARDAERYRGEEEPIDPVAGHIPTAISAPFVENVGEDGRFLPPEELRTRYQRLLGDASGEDVVVYCGSGVTSIHDLIALQYAGLGRGRLYAGSWSEWINDPERPIEREK
jgi:thiosulfate/3-mercaptopyruvate sulfurtransferase